MRRLPPDGMKPPADAGVDTYRAARERWEREWIGRLLEQNGGNVTAAARAAGLDRVSFYRMLWRLGLK